MPYFNRFDICNAWYMFASLFHEGQGSDSYAIFGRLHRLGYEPGLSAQSQRPERLSENAQEIFAQLCRGN